MYALLSERRIDIDPSRPISNRDPLAVQTPRQPTIYVVLHYEHKS